LSFHRDDILNGNGNPQEWPLSVISVSGKFLVRRVCLRQRISSIETQESADLLIHTPDPFQASLHQVAGRDLSPGYLAAASEIVSSFNMANPR